MILGTDSELDARLRNFDQHISEQRQKRKTEDVKRADLDDDIATARKALEDLREHQGELHAEAKVSLYRVGLSGSINHMSATRENASPTVKN